ncbi:hypothetical protein V6N13_055080 [Hibiscus sabdariffa]
MYNRLVQVTDYKCCPTITEAHRRRFFSRDLVYVFVNVELEDSEDIDLGNSHEEHEGDRNVEDVVCDGCGDKPADVVALEEGVQPDSSGKGPGRGVEGERGGKVVVRPVIGRFCRYLPTGRDGLVHIG